MILGMRVGIGGILFLAWASSIACAMEIDVRAEAERVQHLLYEPVVIKVMVTNNADHDIVLRSSANHPWLSFYLSRTDGRIIKPDQPGEFEPLLLKAGESRTLAVNITPLYAFRETGEYKVKAVVALESEEMMTGAVPFTIAKGQKVWSQTRPWQGAQLIYSLVRFSPDLESSSLYVRVEDEQENVVYATYSLGPVVSYLEPQVEFDPKGRLHILHVQGTGAYRYTRVDPYGKPEARVNYVLAPDNTAPQLSKTEDGLVLVAGGRSEDDVPAKEKLSDAQALLAAPPAPPKNAAAKP